MASFLVKTEPSEYAFADLVRDKETTWAGVANPGALGHLRTMRTGDEVLVYHTGDERAIVGLARVSSDPFEDPAKPGLNAAGLPKMAVVKLKPLRAARSVVTLADIKGDPRFADFALVRQGRLSVMPVPPEIDRLLRKLAGL